MAKWLWINCSFLCHAAFFNSDEISLSKQILTDSVEPFTEKGQLLEIHLLKKTARHQNLNCSTPFEQMTKVLDQNEQLLELHLLDKRLKKYQLLDNIFSKENGVQVRQIG